MAAKLTARKHISLLVEARGSRSSEPVTLKRRIQLLVATSDINTSEPRAEVRSDSSTTRYSS